MLEDDILLLQTYETLMHQENSNAESLSHLYCYLRTSLLSEDVCCVGHFRSEAWFALYQL